MTPRKQTRTIKVGHVALGGGAPISVQSMCNVDPHDAKGLIAQIESCAALGCDIMRLTIPDLDAVKTLREVKSKSPIPLVADIHFDYHLALAAIMAGVDALRINPGNIGGRDRVQAVVRAAKAAKIPIRIGVNFGSLEKNLDEKVRAGALAVPEALCASAFGHLKLLEDEGFYDVVISAKASNVADTLATYRLLSAQTDCPLHIGVTEAGTFLPGTVRNSVALGILLSEGIGDTLRVSLTAEPEKEVRVGTEILRALSLRAVGPAITSCPTCGRTRVNLFKVATGVEEALEKLAHTPAFATKPLPHVAVMGCVVNGPGEAKNAEVALCGGKGEFLLYVKGVLKGKVSEENAVAEVLKHVVSL